VAIQGTEAPLPQEDCPLQYKFLAMPMTQSDMDMGWVDPWVGLGWVEFGQI